MESRIKTPLERVHASIFKDTVLATLMVEVLSKIEKSKCSVYFHAVLYNVNYVGKLARDGAFEVYSEEGVSNFFTLRSDKTCSYFNDDVLKQIKEKKDLEWKVPENLREWLEYKKKFEEVYTKYLKEASKVFSEKQAATELYPKELYPKLVNTNKLIKCEYCKGQTFVKREKYESHLKKVHTSDIEAGLFNNEYNVSKRKQEEQKKALLKQKENEKEVQFERLRQDEIDKNTQYLHIIWDDVRFGNNKICLDTKRLDVSVNPVNVEGITESLNLIKKDYFQRLYGDKVYKFAHYKGDINLNKSPGYQRFISTLEFAKGYYDFKFISNTNFVKINQFDHLSNSEILKLFDLSFSKSIYLKYLAKLQNENFKIIPIKEYINNHIEESFLFRIKTEKGTVLTFWENVNESRATHIFISGKEIHSLTLLEGYIVAQNIGNKRSLLHQQDTHSKIIKQKLNYFKSIKHISMVDYEIEVRLLLKHI